MLPCLSRKARQHFCGKAVNGSKLNRNEFNFCQSELICRWSAAYQIRGKGKPLLFFGFCKIACAKRAFGCVDGDFAFAERADLYGRSGYNFGFRFFT